MDPRCGVTQTTTGLAAGYIARINSNDSIERNSYDILQGGPIIIESISLVEGWQFVPRWFAWRNQSRAAITIPSGTAKHCQWSSLYIDWKDERGKP